MLMQLTPFAVRKSIALRQMCAVHWPIYEDNLDDNDKELESLEAKKESLVKKKAVKINPWPPVKKTVEKMKAAACIKTCRLIDYRSGFLD